MKAELNFKSTVFLICLLLMSLCCWLKVNAQEKATKQRKYKIWVYKTDNTRFSGLLYEADETKLRITNSFITDTYRENQFNYQDVYAQDIEKIKARRRGKIAMSSLIGFAAGFALGVIFGEESPGCPATPNLAGAICAGLGAPPPVKRIDYGVFGGMAGGIVGAVIGANRAKIPINGSESKYSANLPRLKKYAYQK